MHFVTTALQALALSSVFWTNGVAALPEDIRPPIPVKTEFLPAHYFPELNSKRVKVNHGLVEVPSMHEDGGMLNTFGRIPLPCEDCLVTSMQAGLEYADGSRADANTGMWLHHTVLSSLNNPNRVCPVEKYGDWFFASGNERTEMNLCESGRSLSGYYIGPDNKMTALTDLMNMLDHKQSVALTMTWEYIPSPPEPGPSTGLTHLIPYWLDIGGCSNSEMPAKPDTHFHYSMPAKEAQIPGEVKMMYGHLHDGGTRLEVLCDGEIVCSMNATYSSYKSAEHLSHISNCSNIGAISPGQMWSLTAHYDTSLHKPMMEHDGRIEPIMGIVLAYVAEENPSMDDGKGKQHNRRGHTLAGVSISLAVLGSASVLGYLWLRRRGEKITDYVPDKVRNFGQRNFGGLQKRITLHGDGSNSSLLEHETLPAYRDED